MSLAYGFTRYGGPEVQGLLDVRVQDPGPGEVQVAVHAAAVNPVDWKVRAGRQRGFLPLQLPAVLGREVAGVVTRVGPDVHQLVIGDRVFGSTVGGAGGYAELALLPRHQTARMPEGLSFADAAVLAIAGGTAHDSLEQLVLGQNGTVVILGVGGGVGTIAAQLARLRGANVVGVASGAKRALVESLGATMIAYDEDDVPSLLATVLPARAEAVLDLVGDGALTRIEAAIDAQTRICTVDALQVAKRANARPVMRVGDTATLDVLAELVVTKRLNPGVGRAFPFSEAGAALALVEGGHISGKVVITVRED
jgi:NADPH:quinone reductase-like Zn-dependent oxidoreductase